MFLVYLGVTIFTKITNIYLQHYTYDVSCSQGQNRGLGFLYFDFMASFHWTSLDIFSLFLLLIQEVSYLLLLYRVLITGNE